MTEMFFPSVVAEPNALPARNARELAAQIGVLLSEWAHAPGELRRQLHRLTRRVSARFSDEESTERYETVMYQAPWLTARTQELRKQQARLVEALDRIRALCDRGDGRRAWRCEVQRRFDEFVGLWREHELAEADLLRDAYESAWMDD